MPSPEDRLRHVQLKLDRARKHAADLRQELQAFLALNPFEVGARRDPDTRKLVYFVWSADGVPDRLALIAGDVLQNLVTALDHLAYQLVCKDTADNPPHPQRIYFPVADDLPRYEASKAERLAGASIDTILAFDALKPYRGGNDRLWIVHRLNNIEKHRLLLAVGSQAGGINLGQLLAGYSAKSFPPEALTGLESMDVFLNPANKGFPLKAGFELYVGAVDEQPNPKQQFRFEIALNEPGIVDGRALLQVIDDSLALVDEVISSLSPRLS